MTPFALLGRGRVRVIAAGVADAERQVEREIVGAWPEARVLVRQIARLDAPERLVGEFEVGYEIRASLAVRGDNLRRNAFRQARRKLVGTPYGGTEWSRGEG